MEEKINIFVEEVKKEINNLNSQLEEKQCNYEELFKQYNKLNERYIKLNKDFDKELDNENWGMFASGFAIGWAILGFLKIVIDNI